MSEEILHSDIWHVVLMILDTVSTL